MAETLDYKVNIDTTNVADQLSMIKNQVDQAMATFSFRSSIPDPQPSMFNAPIGMGMGDFSSSATVGNAMTNAQQDAYSFMESSRMGFHKFMVDAQTVALQTPMGLSQPRDPSQRWMPSFSGSPIGGMFESVTRLGYDPAMSVSPGEYSRRAMESGRRNILGSIETAIGVFDIGTTLTGIGAAAMGATGIAATAAMLAIPATAATIGFGGFMATAGYDTKPALEMRNFAQDISWRSLSGRLSTADATVLGLDASRMQRSDVVMGDRLGGGDVERIMKEVAATGGFDFARTAEDFTEKLRTKVESVRKVMHMLNQSEQEAVQTMGQWDTMGVRTTGGTIGLALRTSAQALAAGYSPSELMQFGNQTAEMNRGTGVSMLSGYIGGMNALADVKQMAKNGNLSEELVQQMGGFQNIAGLIARQGTQWGMSQSGLTSFAAEKYFGAGFNPYDNPLLTQMGAMEELNTPQKLVSAVGRQASDVSKHTADQMYSGKVSNVANLFKIGMAVNGLEFSKDAWVGFNMLEGLDDRVGAEFSYDYIMNTQAGVSNSAMTDRLTKAESIRYKESPGYLSKWADKAGRWITEDVFQTPAVAKAITHTIGQIEYGLRKFDQGMESTFGDKTIRSNYISSAIMQVRGTSSDELAYVGATDKGVAYKDKIAAMSAKYGLDPVWSMEQLRIESDNFADDVVEGSRASRAGAIGIAQFMPDTANEYGVNPYDVDSSLEGYGKYMSAQMKRFKDAGYGDLVAKQLSTAAYNSGPNRKELDRGVIPDYGVDKFGNPTHETPRYVAGTTAAVDAANSKNAGMITKAQEQDLISRATSIGAGSEQALIDQANAVLWGLGIKVNSEYDDRTGSYYGRNISVADIFPDSNDIDSFASNAATMKRIMFDMKPKEGIAEIARIMEAGAFTKAQAKEYAPRIYHGLKDSKEFKEATQVDDLQKLFVDLSGDTSASRALYLINNPNADLVNNEADIAAWNTWRTADKNRSASLPGPRAESFVATKPGYEVPLRAPGYQPYVFGQITAPGGIGVSGTWGNTDNTGKAAVRATRAQTVAVTGIAGGATFNMDPSNVAAEGIKAVQLMARQEQTFKSLVDSAKKASGKDLSDDEKETVKGALAAADKDVVQEEIRNYSKLTTELLADIRDSAAGSKGKKGTTYGMSNGRTSGYVSQVPLSRPA